MLKKGSGKSNVRCEERKEDRRNEYGKFRKKGWLEKVNRTEQSKNLCECLADGIACMKRDLAIWNERESKMSRIGKGLTLH